MNSSPRPPPSASLLITDVREVLPDVTELAEDDEAVPSNNTPDANPCLDKAVHAPSDLWLSRVRNGGSGSAWTGEE